MQVLISLETVICFHLKHAIDFEKVINPANKKERSRRPFQAGPGGFAPRCQSGPAACLSREGCWRSPGNPARWPRRGTLSPCVYYRNQAAVKAAVTVKGDKHGPLPWTEHSQVVPETAPPGPRSPASAVPEEVPAGASPYPGHRRPRQPGPASLPCRVTPVTVTADRSL